MSLVHRYIDYESLHRVEDNVALETALRTLRISHQSNSAFVQLNIHSLTN